MPTPIASDARAQVMNTPARRWSGEPTRTPCRIGDRAIEADGELQRHPWTIGAKRVQEGGVQLGGIFRERSCIDCDTRFPQPFHAAAGLRARVADGDHNARHAGIRIASTHGGVFP